MIEVKIINYANEIGQSKTSLLETVATAVKKLGIPNWVVQVRHDATHHYFPSIKLLREAAIFCRSWLWDIHWKKPIREAMGAVAGTGTVTSSEKAVTLIARYIDFRMKNRKKLVSDDEIYNEDVIRDMHEFISYDSSNFVQAFLFDGHLIMTDEQMEVAGFTVDDGYEIWLIPLDLQLFWEPVLRLLSQLGALPELLYQLVSTLMDHQLRKSKKRQIIAWSDYMLAAFSKIDSISESDWKRIMKALLSVEFVFKPEHYNMVIRKITFLSAKKRKQLRKLLDLSTNSNSVADADQSKFDDTYEIKTLDDLQKRINDGVDGVLQKDPAVEEENWILCDPSVWRGIPLGLTPEQSAESLCLILSNE
uniref:Las1-like family protein n=1 Tax=Syphacia muris TaxID=451379 RepID=A0A0N5AH38_9BILA